MTLQNNQFEIELDTVYELERWDDNFKFVEPSMFIYGGTVDIYTQEEEPEDKTEMQLEDTDISGHNVFETMPRYIYVEESTATVNKIILTGIKPTAV